MSLRSAATGFLTLAVAASGLLIGAGVANAVTPGWEPDPTSRGSINFYNATGQAITGGSVNEDPFVAYAATSGPGRQGDSTATLYVYTPTFGQPPAQWTGGQFSLSTDYPNPAAPPPLNTMTNPVVTVDAGITTLGAYVASNPNVSTDPNWAGLYHVRLVTGAPGSGLDSRYFSTTIRVTGNTWSAEYPPVAQNTTTTLSVSPPSPVNSGTPVTLTANVAPTGVAGSVAFLDGTSPIPGSVSYNPATGVATLTFTPTVGTHSFTAQFTPSASGFNGSTSAAVPYTVNTPGTPTTTTLSATPPSGAQAGQDGTLAVTLTSDTNPDNIPGSVHYFDGSTDLGAGTYNQADGTATLAVTLSTGTHLLTATFTPSVSGVQPSTSAILSYVVLPYGSTSAAIPIEATDNTPPFAGSLVLQVTTGTSVQMTQVDPNTPAGHPVDATDPTGHRHTWVFTGNLTGVAVVDTRPDTSGGHGLGWTLNGQAASFVNGQTNYPASYLGWSPALAGGDAEGTVTPGAAVDSRLKTPTSDGLLTSKLFARAASGNGLGTQNVSSGFELRIPDTSPTGVYASTLTVTLISP